MVRSSVIIALVAFVLMSVNCSEDSNFEVTLVTNNATNLAGKAESLLDYTVTHTFGRREFGDVLVGFGSNSYDFVSPQDVQLTISYPVSGPGAIVTNVEIEVKQSSNIHTSYITSGGIGQRYISIVVIAKNTLYFNYIAQVYGR